VNKHGFFTVLLAIMLAAVMMLTLSACNQGEQNGTTAPTEGTTAPTTGDEANYPTIKGAKLSWDLINSVPVKTANMDITEARKLCVDFFRISKTALWIPDTKYEAKDADGKVLRTMEGGKIYAGLPLLPKGHGNIYRLMDYIDPQTGVVDVQAAGKKLELFGNECSGAAYWGWGRVINSVAFNFPEKMLHKNGYLRLGSYTYDDSVDALSTSYRTTDILKSNDAQVIYQAYALLKAGDGVVYFTSAGHMAMISQDAHVEYKADGTIDPAKSYVYIIDQAGTWKEGTNAEGDTFTYAIDNDVKWTFITMFNKQYMPFTFAEWQGTDPIEETVISYSHTGSTISLDQLYGSQVTCNYGLSDVYAIIKDNGGKEVYKLAVRPTAVHQMTMTFEKDNQDNVAWGSLETLDQTKEYTVEIIAQIATGERPTLWTGKLAQ
jgi:hypothetical protein